MSSNQDLYKQSKIEIKQDDGYSPVYIIDIIGSTENAENQSIVEVNEQTRFKIKLKSRSDLQETTIDKLYVCEPINDEQFKVLRKGDIVEAFSNLDIDDQPKRWKKAEIEMVNSESGVFSVRFLANQDPESDDRTPLKKDDNIVTAMLSQTDLRPANQSKKLSANRFFKIEVPISKELDETLTGNIDWLSEPDTHFYFQNKIGAISTKFNAESKSLTLIGYEKDDFNMDVMNKRLLMMLSLHMKNLKNRCILAKKLEDAEKKLAEVKSTDAVPEDESNSDAVIVKFYVPQSLIGLSIGHQGKNMATAKEIEGVIDVHFEKDRSTMVIKGETSEACAKARALLEHVEKEVRVTRRMTGKLIGKSGSVMEEIIENSGVLRIRLQNEPKEHDEYVTFIIVGTKESVENAEMLFDCYLSGLEEIDLLREKQSEILHQLNEYHAPGSTLYVPERKSGYGRTRYQGRSHRSGRQSSWSYKSKPSSAEHNQHKKDGAQEDQRLSESDNARMQEKEISSSVVEGNRSSRHKSNSRHSKNKKSSKTMSKEQDPQVSNSESNQDTRSNGRQFIENASTEGQPGTPNQNASKLDKLNIDSISLTVENLAKLNVNDGRRSYDKKYRTGRNYNRMNGRPRERESNYHYNDRRMDNRMNNRMDNRRRPSYRSFNQDHDYNPYANY